MRGFKMNELDRAIFDDLILCFFGKKSDLENSYWRNSFLDGYDYGEKAMSSGYRVAFSEGEICDDILEVSETASCGCCTNYNYKPANYIKE
jgi:hypothetical protein